MSWLNPAMRGKGCALALSVLMLGALITSCGVDKQTLLNDACSNLEKAWSLRSSEKKDEIEKKSQYYRVASDLFKELAYIQWDEQSLKFVEYHNLAFEGAQGYVDLTSYTSQPFWGMINFCELERAKR